MPRRHPRGTTHVTVGRHCEVFYKRLGKQVLVFSEGRGEWFATQIKPEELHSGDVKRLTTIEQSEVRK